MAEHVDEPLDVLVVVLEGRGEVVVDWRAATPLPRGSRSSSRAGRAVTSQPGDAGLRYLSVDRRRGPLQIQPLQDPLNPCVSAPIGQGRRWAFGGHGRSGDLSGILAALRAVLIPGEAALMCSQPLSWPVLRLPRPRAAIAGEPLEVAAEAPAT